MTGDDARAAGLRALDAAFAETARGIGASVGALFLRAPKEPVLRLDVLYGAPAEFAAPWARVPLAAPAPVADAARDERMVWLGSHEHVARSYPRTAVALPYPMALAAAPVTGARPWGALLLMWPASRPPHMSARERGHITAGCRRLARLVEEAAGEDALPPPDAPLRVVPTGRERTGAGPDLAAADFAERLPGGSCAVDLSGRFTYLSAGACDLLGRDAGDLLGTLPWQSLRWLDDPVCEDRYRAAVLSRQPVAFTALRPPDRRLDFHLYPDASGISVRIVPSGTEPPPRRDRAPAPPARAGRLYQLTHLAVALAEAVGVQDVLDLVADQVLPAFGAQGMILSAAEAGRLRIIGTRGYGPEAVERLDALPVDSTLTPAGRTLRTGLPAFFGRPEELRRFYPDAPVISGKQAWAFLPLILSGRAVGCCLLSYERPHGFPAEERAVLTALAGLIAQALDRARLYDTKLDLAHSLQQALLPRTLPAVPGLRVAARYLPATRGMDIGGDFYDLIRLGDGAAAAVIGDVQGHNAAAAALMGQVRTAVHANASRGTPPEQVLTSTNRLLTDLGSDLFTSCLYAHLDLVRGRAVLATAGHPPPLVRLPGGETRPVEMSPGPLLGIDPGAGYPHRELPLVPGMTLLFYTDGLVERPGADLDDAIAGLARHFARAGDRDLDGLIDDLLAEADPAGPRTDDVALLALRLGPGDGA